MRRLLAVALLAAACGPAAPSVASPSASAAPPESMQPSPSATAIVTAFDGARAREHIAYLADPARGGRYSGSAGYRDAAQYVADQFKAIGLEPLGDDGTYFERFTMPIVDLAATPVLSRTGADARSWKHRLDFTESVNGRAGNGSAEAPLSVVGGGARSGTQDDYAGANARGHVVLITGPTSGNIVETAFAAGAVGVLVTGDATIRYSYLPRFVTPTLPVLVITDSVAEELLAPAGKRVGEVRDAVRARRANAGAPPVGFDLPSTIRMAVPLTPVRDVETVNVVGLLRGVDPLSAARAVLVGGHLDGVGTDPDGTVFSAANDNASGPGITIEVARALAAHQSELKRSVVFVAWAGEEEGYFGSEAYAAKMAQVPGRIESLVAYLNLDVIACCGSTLQATNESQDLQDRVGAAARRLGVPFNAPRGGGGSDQTTFSRRGVPSTLILWNDVILHTTKDTIAVIDTRKLQMAGDVVTTVTLELGRGEGP